MHPLGQRHPRARPHPHGQAVAHRGPADRTSGPPKAAGAGFPLRGRFVAALNRSVQQLLPRQPIQAIAQTKRGRPAPRFWGGPGERPFPSPCNRRGCCPFPGPTIPPQDKASEAGRNAARRAAVVLFPGSLQGGGCVQVSPAAKPPGLPAGVRPGTTPAPVPDRGRGPGALSVVTADVWSGSG
jgi:hypothetical protein